jgi:hypothetical protein
MPNCRLIAVHFGIGRKGHSFLSASIDPVRHFGWLDIFDTT